MNRTAKWLLAMGLLLGCSAVYGLDFGQLLNSISKPEEQKQGQQQGSGMSSLFGSLLKAVAGTSQDEEIAIGSRISGNLLGAAPLVRDNALQKYVNNIGRWVANQSERPDLPWHFGVIESGDVNAFAAPGGYVFITRGLYLLLQNEAELAGVLGHEIGHVILKHHLKILQQSNLLDAGSKLVANEVGGDDMMRKMIGSGAEVISRSLDKNAEFDADRIGVVLSARAGYDVFGLPAVLQEIGHFSKDDGNIALLFKTHPHPDERMDKLGIAMGDKFDLTKGQSLKNRLYRIDAPAPTSVAAAQAMERENKEVAASVATAPAPMVAVPAPVVVTPTPVAPAPVANPDQKTVDEQYNVRAATECKTGFLGLVCREMLKSKLCEGKWTETPSVGQSLCKKVVSNSSN